MHLVSSHIHNLGNEKECVCADGAKGPGDSGNMKDDEGRNNLKHKNLLQPCFVNFPANLSRAPELLSCQTRPTLARLLVVFDGPVLIVDSHERPLKCRHIKIQSEFYF